MNHEESIAASRAIRLKHGQPRYLVDGHEFPNEASNLTIDGNYPPFYVFDVDRQEHAEFGWGYRTKAAAKRLNKQEESA